MADDTTPIQKSNRLHCEELEAREVPTSFGFFRGLSVALADVMPGDNQQEYITGTGPGRVGVVRVWSEQGVLRAKLNPFPGFTGGIYVATGDVDGDGTPELICSTAPGTVGQVKVYAFRSGGPQVLASFEPFGPTYAGGVQIAAGDVTGGANPVTGGRIAEVVVGRERGTSTVKVFSVDASLQQAFEIRSFQAFGPNYHGGVTVAAANVDITLDTPDNSYEFNYAEIITGMSSQLPKVRVFDAQTNSIVTRASWFAYDISNPFNRQGINVAAGSTDGRRGAEIYVGLRYSGTIRIFNGYTSGFYGQIQPYPPSFSRTVNFFVNSTDDDFNGIYTVGSLVTVGGDGPFLQVPVIFPGKTNSPAGLNGSQPAG